MNPKRIISIVIVVVATACALAVLFYRPGSTSDDIRLSGTNKKNRPVPPPAAWRFKAAGACKSAPIIVEDNLYLTSSGKEFYCLSAGDGKKRWSYPTKDGSESVPKVVGRRVLFSSIDNGVYCLDRFDGKLLWRFETKDGIYSSPRIYVSAAGAETVIVGSMDNRIYSLDLESGLKRWDFDAGGRIIGSPAIAGGRVWFAICEEAVIYVLDADNGKLVKKFPPLEDEYLQADVVSVGDDVIVSSSAGSIMRIDGADSRIVWKSQIGSAVYGAPCVSGRFLYVCSAYGRLCKIDLSNGSIVWSFSLRAGWKGSPFAVGDSVVACDESGWVYIVSSEGRQRWSYELGGDLGSPAVYNGLIIVGDEMGFVYALKTPPGLLDVVAATRSAVGVGGGR